MEGIREIIEDPFDTYLNSPNVLREIKIISVDECDKKESPYISGSFLHKKILNLTKVGVGKNDRLVKSWTHGRGVVSWKF